MRYIDAVDFDFERDDIWGFLSDKLKVKLDICTDLFDNTGVRNEPLGFNMILEFPSTTPAGAAILRFARGRKGSQDALVWETQITARGADVPSGKDELSSWVGAAHDLTHDWFFKMIEGELYERFK